MDALNDFDYEFVEMICIQAHVIRISATPSARGKSAAAMYLAFEYYLLHENDRINYVPSCSYVAPTQSLPSPLPSKQIDVLP